MRKTPRQARSRATVDIILEAGARILGDVGWAGLTTNKVADLAGVSIGSLYQYFPDKLSLVDMIRRHHLNDCLTVMQKSTAVALPLPEFVEKLVSAMIAAHSDYPGLHRALLDEAPSSDEYRDPNSAFEKEYLRYYLEAVMACKRGKAGQDDQIAALIISDAIDGVIHNAARRGMLGNPVVQSELVRLIQLYLGDVDDGSVGRN